MESNGIRCTRNIIEFLRNSLLISGTPKHQGIPMEFLDICIPQGVGKGFFRPRWDPWRFLKNSLGFQGSPGDWTLLTDELSEVSSTRVEDTSDSSSVRSVQSPGDPWNPNEFFKNRQGSQRGRKNPLPTPWGMQISRNSIGIPWCFGVPEISNEFLRNSMIFRVHRIPLDSTTVLKLSYSRRAW